MANGPDREDLLRDAVWQALTTSQQHLGLSYGRARRYRAEFTPFAAVKEQTAAAMLDLRALLEPGESVYVVGPQPADAIGLERSDVRPVLQMLFPSVAPLPAVTGEIQVEPLDCSQAAEMSALIAVAYPGFFRAKTCSMGRYYGVRDPAGQLIAMGGERLVVGDYREVSGLCILPGHTGRGLGTAVLHRILADQRAGGAVPWLYVLESNQRAVQLYRHLGFQDLRRVDLHRITRVRSAF